VAEAAVEVEEPPLEVEEVEVLDFLEEQGEQLHQLV
jgi:hypothetical protein